VIGVFHEEIIYFSCEQRSSEIMPIIYYILQTQEAIFHRDKFLW